MLNNNCNNNNAHTFGAGIKRIHAFYARHRNILNFTDLGNIMHLLYCNPDFNLTYHIIEIDRNATLFELLETANKLQLDNYEFEEVIAHISSLMNDTEKNETDFRLGNNKSCYIFK